MDDSNAGHGVLEAGLGRGSTRPPPSPRASSTPGGGGRRVHLWLAVMNLLLLAVNMVVMSPSLLMGLLGEKAVLHEDTRPREEGGRGSYSVLSGGGPSVEVGKKHQQRPASGGEEEGDASTAAASIPPPLQPPLPAAALSEGEGGDMTAAPPGAAAAEPPVQPLPIAGAAAEGEAWGGGGVVRVWPGGEPPRQAVSIPQRQCAEAILEQAASSPIPAAGGTTIAMGLQYEGRAPFTPHLGIDHVYVMTDSKVGSLRLPGLRAGVLDYLGFNGASYIRAFDKANMTGEAAECLNDQYRPGRDIEYWVSLGAKHMLAVWDMVGRGYNTTLILEDDACMAHTGPSAATCGGAMDLGVPLPGAVYGRMLQAWVQEATAAKTEEEEQGGGVFDVMFLGTCNELVYDYCDKQDRKRSSHLYDMDVSRCTSSLLVSRRGALRLLSSLPCTGPIDIHFNNMKKRDGSWRYYHTQPPLLGQSNMGGSARRGVTEPA